MQFNEEEKKMKELEKNLHLELSLPSPRFSPSQGVWVRKIWVHGGLG